MVREGEAGPPIDVTVGANGLVINGGREDGTVGVDTAGDDDRRRLRGDCSMAGDQVMIRVVQ